MQQAIRTVHVGVIRLGTVGGAPYASSAASGQLPRCVRHRYRGNTRLRARRRPCGRQALTGDAFTSDWRDITSDLDIDIVVELIGGDHPATEIFEDAIAHRKHVVSANKALLESRWARSRRMRARRASKFSCEAACGGGIPIVSTLEHDLVGNKILTIAGILNGTTNYILSRMDAEGLDFADVLADAQRLGYAEADPTADVDGHDAAAKLAILSSIAFHTRVTTDDVYQQGIRTIGAEDIAQARELGYTIKLLGIARNTDAGVDVRVHPTLIPADHMLAKVNGAMNAVYVVGDAVGETMFYGAGAGSFPTASAVVGDILSLSEQISRGVAPLPEIEPYGHNLAFKPMDELQTKYYVRLKVADRVGALSETVDIFAKHNISISLINRRGRQVGRQRYLLGHLPDAPRAREGRPGCHRRACQRRLCSRGRQRPAHRGR